MDPTATTLEDALFELRHARCMLQAAIVSVRINETCVQEKQRAVDQFTVPLPAAAAAATEGSIPKPRIFINCFRCHRFGCKAEVISQSTKDGKPTWLCVLACPDDCSTWYECLRCHKIGDRSAMALFTDKAGASLWYCNTGCVRAEREAEHRCDLCGKKNNESAMVFHTSLSGVLVWQCKSNCRQKE